MTSDRLAKETQVVQRATMTLNDAQIKALPAAPVEIVAAPGAGKMIVPLSAIFVADFRTAYSGIDAATSFPGISLSTSLLSGFYDDSDVPTDDLTSLLTTTDPSLAGIFVLDLNPQLRLVVDSTLVVTRPTSSAPSNSDALLLQGTNSINFGGGNAANTLTVIVAYTLIDLPA